jgi:hypothetical protein
MFRFLDNKDADPELVSSIVEAWLSGFQQQIHLIANTKGNTHTYRMNVSAHDE